MLINIIANLTTERIPIKKSIFAYCLIEKSYILHTLTTNCAERLGFAELRFELYANFVSFAKKYILRIFFLI